MSSVQRKRSGESSPVPVKIQAGKTVSVGDLVGKSGDYVDSYAGITADIATSAFNDVFGGVLIEGATFGNETHDTDGLMETIGEFEYPLSTVAAAEYPIGTFVGPTGNQEVDMLVVGAVAEAIGRLARPVHVGDTTALVRIESTVMCGAIHV